MIELIETFIFVWISAFIDQEHLKDNDYIESHASRYTLRVLVMLLIWTPTVLLYCYDIHESFRWNILVGTALLFASTFDTILNIMMKGKDGLYFLGDTSTWDRFWKGKLYPVYKILVPITFIASIIITLLHRFL